MLQIFSFILFYLFITLFSFILKRIFLMKYLNFTHSQMPFLVSTCLFFTATWARNLLCTENTGKTYMYIIRHVHHKTTEKAAGAMTGETRRANDDSHWASHVWHYVRYLCVSYMNIKFYLYQINSSWAIKQPLRTLHWPCDLEWRSRLLKLTGCIHGVFRSLEVEGILFDSP